jgi:transposase-like protein
MKGNKYYSDSFKREVVREVLAGHLSKEEARRKYNIKGGAAVLYWIRKFADQDQLKNPDMDYKKSDKRDLIKRIKELERQLEDEQIRSYGYSKMIDIAEDQLKVSIRKKPDTKQSKK